MDRRTASRCNGLLLGLLVTLAGCGGAEAPKTSDLDGTWVGPLHAIGGNCPTDAQATLLIDHATVLFTPTSGVLELQGHRAPDGDTLHAQLLLQDMNHHSLPMVFEGRSAVEQTPSGPALRIDGTYGSPTCRASVSLRRQIARPWKNLIGR